MNLPLFPLLLRLRTLLQSLSLLILAGIASAADLPADARAHAERAANAFLALVDAGRFDESYIQTSSLFRNAVAQDGWSRVVRATRDPLGAVKSRIHSESRYSTTMAGAPDGEYVTLRYETTFERKASAVETLTTMRDSDGQWRVAGYFIK